MVQPGLCEVRGIALFLQICLHQGDGPRLVVKGAQVHRLHAQPLLHGEEAGAGTVQLFLPSCSFDRPVKVLPAHEVRQPDDGYPAEGVLVPIRALLLPEALQRRHDIFKKALDLVAGFVTHLYGVRNGVQDADRLLVCAALRVRVPGPADGDIVGRRDVHYLRRVPGHIEFPVFFLEIKGHGHPSSALGPLCNTPPPVSRRLKGKKNAGTE